MARRAAVTDRQAVVVIAVIGAVVTGLGLGSSSGGRCAALAAGRDFQPGRSTTERRRRRRRKVERRGAKKEEQEFVSAVSGVK